MIKIACQTIVFGNTIKDNISEIAGTIKKIGYDGIEIGARHFDLEKPDFYIDLFKRVGLKLIAIHVGGDFLNKDSVQKQLDNVKNIIGFGSKLECPYLFLSGLRKEGKTCDDYKIEAENYSKIGKMCNDVKIKLCYHNHDWEFSNDGSNGMKTLLENIPEDLMMLVPDVGWLTMAGIDPVQFLRENINRVEALHFKDFSGPRQFTELGTGLVPFKKIYDYAANLGRDWWIVAEQDQTIVGPEEASRINYEYIKNLNK